MNKRLKKSIIIILALVAIVAVVSATAIFFVKQRDKKYNHIDKINLQSYAGNNVLSESAFDNGYICQIFNSYNPQETDSNFEEGKFYILLYNINDNESVFYPIQKPSQRTMKDDDSRESFTYLYDNIAMVDDLIIVSFTTAKYIENNAGSKTLSYFEPTVFLYSKDGDFQGEFPLKEITDIDAAMIPNQGSLVADGNYLYAISSANTNISTPERNRENKNEEIFDNYLTVYDYKGDCVYYKKISMNSSLTKAYDEGAILCDDGKISFINGDLEQAVNDINSINSVLQCGNGNYSIVYQKKNSIYGYNAENNKSTKLMTLSNETQMRITSQGAYYWNDEIYCAYNEGSVTSDTLIMLKRGKEKEQKDNGTKLVIGTTNEFFSLGKLSTDFHKMHSEYQIEIREYESEEQLIEAIAKSEQIDLVDLSSINQKTLEDKGLLVDFYKYIDADSDLSRDDFNEDVMKIFETDGHLYEAFPGYFPVTILVKSSVMEQNWNYDQLTNIAEKNSSFFYREEMLNYAYLRYKNAIYSNESTSSSCNFTNSLFLTEFEKTKDYTSYEALFSNETDNINIMDIFEKRGMIETSLNIYDLAFMSYYNENNSDEMIIAGYTMDDGNYSYYGEAISLGILSNSSQKDMAWEYVKPYFTKEFQTVECFRSGFFPTRKDSLNLLNEVICSKNDKKIECIGDISAFSGNRAFDFQYDTIEWGPANLSNIQQYEESLVPAIKYPTKNEIYSMLAEEAEPYWNGNKSAKECMDTVNSRVSIYLKERE